MENTLDLELSHIASISHVLGQHHVTDLRLIHRAQGCGIIYIMYIGIPFCCIMC